MNLKKAIGILLIVGVVWGLLAPIDSANEASGWGKFFLLLISPLIVGLGLWLIHIGSSTKKSSSASIPEKTNFKSTNVSPVRVIFVIGFIIFIVLILYVTKILLSAN